METIKSKVLRIMDTAVMMCDVRAHGEHGLPVMTVDISGVGCCLTVMIYFNGFHVGREPDYFKNIYLDIDDAEKELDEVIETIGNIFKEEG